MLTVEKGLKGSYNDEIVVAASTKCCTI